MTTRTLTVAEAEALAAAALVSHGVPDDLAPHTARALVLAECDGLSSHGLARLPFYLAQARSGKIVAAARPAVVRDGAVVRVDGANGLAFPAIALGCAAARDVARELGVAAVSIGRSHHFGVAGQPVEDLARDGFVALALSNSPAAMAPWGGSQPLYGTNPIAFAVPRAGGDPMVIDLSLSHVARGKVMIAQKRGEAIPEGWALDAEGRPTTDPTAAMGGTMVPAGGAKGAALALMVELLSVALSGANYAYEASSMFDAEGPPPGLGHFLLVIDPARFHPGFAERTATLLEAIIAQPGARLPGDRRYGVRARNSETLTLPAALVAELEDAAGRAGNQSQEEAKG